ncbi:MAG: cupredoxin domain-containing protein [Gaiellaceae bacterium]
MRLRSILLLVVTAALALSGVAYAATSTAKVTAPIKITVTLKDYSFGFSRASVPAGSTVLFTVKNVGSVQHNVDFTSLNKRSTIIAPGAKTTLKVVFKKKGSIQVVCDVPRHIQLGMVSSFRVK